MLTKILCLIVITMVFFLENSVADNIDGTVEGLTERPNLFPRFDRYRQSNHIHHQRRRGSNTSNQVQANDDVRADDDTTMSDDDRSDNDDVSTSNETNNNENKWFIPAVGSSWHWQLTGEVDTSHDVDIYDIDLYDSPFELIENLQSDGKKVICYFSAGTYENYRSDIDLFPSKTLGNIVGGWPDERWLDIRSSVVREIMEMRLDLASDKGCDGVEPDNVDGYSNDTGFLLVAGDQLDYNRFLADAAHQRGLSIALKNNVEQAEALVDFFDFAINEECHEYDECDILKSFTDAGKAVFNAEYAQRYINNKQKRSKMCSESFSLKMYTLILPLDLDGSFYMNCED